MSGYEGQWERINWEIRRCIESYSTPQARISCLMKLLSKYGEDGMILYALGEEYELMGDLDQAEEYYIRAEEAFPLRCYKHMARKGAERVRRLRKMRISRGRPGPSTTPIDEKISEQDETLYVVACSKKKVWDIEASAPLYVPARLAYRGDGFLKFLRFIEPLESAGVRWLILSAKYGFIEPWHPIANYDVSFDDPTTGPISDDTLRNQVLYQTRWSNGKPLRDFKVVIVFGPDTYVRKVAKAYEGVAAVRRLKLS